jgi:hypothetical protein
MGSRSRSKRLRKNKIEIRFIRPTELEDPMNSFYQEMVKSSTANSLDRRVMRFIEITREDVIAQGFASFHLTKNFKGHPDIWTKIVSKDPTAKHFESEKDMNDICSLVRLMHLKEYSVETIYKAGLIRSVLNFV